MNDTTDGPQATTRPAARPPLRRPREGRVLAGVAAGIADHLGIDVAIVRILTVVATFVTSGFGLIVYIVAIFVIPETDEQEEQEALAARSERTTEGSFGQHEPAFWIGVGLLVLGVLWLFGGVLSPVRGLGVIRPDLVWPLVLIGFGLALWKASDRRVTDRPPASPVPPPPPAPTTPPAGATPPAAATSRPTTPPAPPASPAASAPPSDRPTSATPAAPPAVPTGASDENRTERIMTPQQTARLDAASSEGRQWVAASGASEGTDPGGEHAAYPAGTEPPDPPRTGQPADGGERWAPPPNPKRSLLTRITLGAALVTVGVLWLLDVGGVIAIGVVRIAAAALLVTGLGLLVGSWFGRGRWLILVGSLLLPLVLVAELLRPFGLVNLPNADVRGGFGEIVTAPADLGDLESSYQLGAGSVHLDLREVEFDRPTDLSVHVGAGEVIVQLPADVTADVTARTGVGEHRIGDRVSSGFGVPTRRQQVETGAGSELLTLEVSVGFGEATVEVTDDGEQPAGRSDDADASSSLLSLERHPPDQQHGRHLQLAN